MNQEYLWKYWSGTPHTWHQKCTSLKKQNFIGISFIHRVVPQNQTLTSKAQPLLTLVSVANTL